MTPNKTTEQPIPSDFMVWAEKHIKETFPFVPIPNKAGEERVTPVGHSPFGYNKYRKEKGKLMKMAIDSYCHLHSLPSSPVGEAVARWVKADLSQGWKDNPSREIIVRIGGMKYKYDVTTPATIIYFLQQGREIYFLQEEQTSNHGK